MHWYDRQGNPKYNATLKEAREGGFLPSITECLKMEANYGLENYKIRSAVEGALTLPRMEDEKDKDFIDRVLQDGKEHAKRAAKIGTIIHHLIARYIMGKPLFYTGNVPEIWKIFEPVKNWIDENIVLGAVELRLANASLGFAGTCDFRGFLDDKTIVRIDWKTQNVKHPGFWKNNSEKKLKDKVYFYDSFCCQLVGYEALDKIGTDKRMSVIIGTNPENYGVWTRTWTEDEERKAMKKLFALRDILYINKKL